MPFQANVRAEVGGTLESPRVFMPGYTASVDGQPARVMRSDEGLAEVQVAPGVHAVVIRFAAPLLLGLSYWAAIGAWSATLLLAAIAALRPKN
jgi:hypothetical protein